MGQQRDKRKQGKEADGGSKRKKSKQNAEVAVASSASHEETKDSSEPNDEPNVGPELLPLRSEAQAVSALAMVPTNHPLAKQPSMTNANDLTNDEMLAHMHSIISKDPSQWCRDLPVVRIKAKYLKYEIPKAKGNAEWPKLFNKDKVELPAFKDFLVNACDKKTKNVKVILTCVGRVLGALESEGKDAAQMRAEVVEARTMVALYVANEITKFLQMALFSPRYSWTLKTIDDLCMYCDFHIRQITKNEMACEPGPWRQYINVLNEIKMDLKRGVRKRCAEERERRSRLKFHRDNDAIKNLPAVKDMQKCLKDGYIRMRILSNEFADKPSLTAGAQMEANSIIAAGIYLDTFGGRSMEWEIALYDHVKDMMDKGNDFIVCSEHKTSMTYGDLAKYISPGLHACFRCYMDLPRPNDCDTFLVPVDKRTPIVSIRKALSSFCARNWPADKTKLRVNIMRKFFHKTLMKMTESQEKLKDVMMIVDAHSKAQQTKTYCMRDPEDDVRLARHLVDEVLGATVAWPSDKEVENYASGNVELVDESAQIDLASALEEIISAAEKNIEDEDDDEDDEDLELEWWESGDIFGVRNSRHQLAPLCASVDGDASAIHALCDQNISEVAKGSKDVGAAGENKLALEEDEEKFPDEKKKNHNKNKTKGKVHDEYTEKKLDTDPKRLTVSDAAHAFMRKLVQKWQAENGKEEFERPLRDEWYHDARVKAIQAGHITKSHCKDVVKSYIHGKYPKKAHASNDVD